jgi:hypothetical protein
MTGLGREEPDPESPLPYSIQRDVRIEGVTHVARDISSLRGERLSRRK